MQNLVKVKLYAIIKYSTKYNLDLDKSYYNM
jgi:hypothetical protein